MITRERTDEIAVFIEERATLEDAREHEADYEGMRGKGKYLRALASEIRERITISDIPKDERERLIANVDLFRREADHGHARANKAERERDEAVSAREELSRRYAALEVNYEEALTFTESRVCLGCGHFKHSNRCNCGCTMSPVDDVQTATATKHRACLIHGTMKEPNPLCSDCAGQAFEKDARPSPAATKCPDCQSTIREHGICDCWTTEEMRQAYADAEPSPAAREATKECPSCMTTTRIHNTACLLRDPAEAASSVISSNRKTYTIDEIKAAFREEYHRSGESFFPYPDMGASEEECERVTDAEWESFMAALDAAREGK